MYKKMFLSLAILACMIFSFTACFAAGNDGMLKDAADGVRNVVGGAENAIEDAAKGVSDASKDATGDMENGANKDKNDMTNNDGNNGGNNEQNNGTTTDANRTSTTGMNNGYTATRTATDTGATTFMGMTATAWTWLILGIAGIAIVALVWYYGTQANSTNNYDDRD